LQDHSREAYIVVLEDLSQLELWSSIGETDAWKDEHIGAAIRGLGSIHATWYGREEELLRQPWIGAPLTTQDMIEMRELWSDLKVHAANAFPEWFLKSDLVLRQKFIEKIPEWRPQLESAPRTLIHNNFNPKNIAFRREPDALHLVAYNWELATIGLPQHD